MKRLLVRLSTLLQFLEQWHSTWKNCNIVCTHILDSSLIGNPGKLLLFLVWKDTSLIFNQIMSWLQKAFISHAHWILWYDFCYLNCFCYFNVILMLLYCSFHNFYPKSVWNFKLESITYLGMLCIIWGCLHLGKSLLNPLISIMTYKTYPFLDHRDISTQII